jgi:uncharacterized protein involved in exopolysaccharide biosynthesis
MRSHLKVEPLRRTTLIRVTYLSSDPAVATRVLSELARLYLEKHLTLHRPPGAYEFFTAQAERFRAELSAAEARLKQYGRQEHVVSADVEREGTLERLADFEAGREQARSAIADATRRMAEIEAEIAATPARHTTQVRTWANAELIRQLKSRVLDLELQQAEMLRKFTPTYRPVVEVTQQLAQVRAALVTTERAPFTDETTDQNPTHQWLQSELARVKTERGASIARANALADSVREYREKARRLDDKATAQQDLRRTTKSAEENYLLYRRKQEEARISDALDRTRIANVALADAPSVPGTSSTGSAWILMLGAILSILAGTGITYLLNALSPYFRTPEEVESALDVPVLATFPSPD